MPIHNWTRVDSGLFHAFHQGWICALSDALNRGCLPDDYFALSEQSIRSPVPDILALRLSQRNEPRSREAPGVAVATAPPRARLIQRRESAVYVRKADRVKIRHRHGEIVAVIEIVSPGNKAGNTELRAFVQKASDLVQQGVHLLVIDLFPPTKRDPEGLHNVIWDEIGGDDIDGDAIDSTSDKPLTVVSYDAGPPQVAYVEPLACGDELSEMPLFLLPEHYIPAPLETSCQTTWDVFPRAMKGLLEGR